MRKRHLVLKELWQRKNELLTSFLAVTLAIVVIVSVRTIAVSAKENVKTQMHGLGSNILVIPKSVEVSNYYLADFGDDEMPEEYAHTLNSSEISDKVHNMVPKLSSRLTLHGSEIILTGVLPKDELRKAPKWQVPTLFRPAKQANAPSFRKTGKTTGEQSTHGGFPSPGSSTTKVLKIERKTVDSLDRNDVLVGAEAARLLNVDVGQTLDIKGKQFTVADALSETGTVDDIRIFAHLQSVQDMLGKGRTINAIEIVGCGCKTDLAELTNDIEDLLPGTRAITIKHVAETQANVIKMMQGFAFLFLVVILPIGAATIANYMAGNVHDRRQEIGTLLALGATPRLVVSMFLQKAILLGISGGIAGYLMGTCLALFLGPEVTDVSVHPLPSLSVLAIGVASLLCLVASAIPSYRAANLEPARTLREE